MRVLQVIRKSRPALIVLAGILLLPVLSCTGGELYYRFRQIERGEWQRDTILVFSVDSLSPGSGQPIQVSLEITANRSYPYRDLWLRVEHNLTDSLLRSDTLRLQLADAGGRRLGSSAGGLYQLTHPWLQLVIPDSNRQYKIRIHHLMSDDPLSGIEKAGVKMVLAK